MANPLPKDPAEAIAKLKTDLEFWRSNYDKSETELRTVSSKLVQQSSELVQAKDDLVETRKTLVEMANVNEELKMRLVRVLDHTAGKTAMLTISHQFCAVCENPHLCVHGEARRYLAVLDQPIQAKVA